MCEPGRPTEPGDLINFVMLDAIEGSLLARDGRFEEAIEQGRRAVELTEGSDGLENLALPRRYLAETFFLAGRTEDAARGGRRVTGDQRCEGRRDGGRAHTRALRSARTLRPVTGSSPDAANVI